MLVTFFYIWTSPLHFVGIPIFPIVSLFPKGINLSMCVEVTERCVTMLHMHRNEAYFTLFFFLPWLFAPRQCDWYLFAHLFECFIDSSEVTVGSFAGYVVTWGGKIQDHYQLAFMKTSESVIRPYTDSQQDTLIHRCQDFHSLLQIKNTQIVWIELKACIYLVLFTICENALFCFTQNHLRVTISIIIHVFAVHTVLTFISKNRISLCCHLQ